MHSSLERNHNRPWVLEVVTGYRLELVQTPFQMGPVYSVAHSSKERLATSAEIQSLLSKGAVEEVIPQINQFTNSLFVIPKKDGSSTYPRPLNCFMENYHFRDKQGQRTAEAQRLDVFSGPERRLSFGAHSQATQEIPQIHMGRNHLRIYLPTIRSVQCTEVSMSSGGSPAFPRSENCDLPRRHAEDKEILQLQVHQALTLLKKLGFVINIPKSLLTPSCQITYLGLLVDSVSIKLCLTEEKLQQTTHSCRELVTRLSVTVQDLSSVIGKLTPTRLAVLLAPVYTRSLQQQLIETLRSTGSSKARMTLNQASQDDFQWWIHQLQHWNGRAIMTPPPDMIIQMLLSKDGEQCTTALKQGLWSIPESKRHINSLELLAGSLAIQTFAEHRNNVGCGQHYSSGICEQDGGHTLSASLPTVAVVSTTRHQSLAQHLPGNLNTMADQESQQREMDAQ